MYKHTLSENDLKRLHELVPAHTAGSLQRYLEDRIPPGGFLSAVLKNDLWHSVDRADDENLRALTNIVKWIVSYAPACSWGSEEALVNWLNGKP